MEPFFHATANSWVMPVTLSVIAWAVVTSTLNRTYSLPNILLKISEILLMLGLVALALLAWGLYVIG